MFITSLVAPSALKTVPRYGLSPWWHCGNVIVFAAKTPPATDLWPGDVIVVKIAAMEARWLAAAVLPLGLQFEWDRKKKENMRKNTLNNEDERLNRNVAKLKSYIWHSIIWINN